MNPINRASLAEIARRLWLRLLVDFPELEFDEEAKVLAIDSETGAIDAIAAMVRQSRADAAMADGLKTLIGEYERRAERLRDRAARRREAARDLMEAIGVVKIERPEFTLSLSPAPQSVREIDASLIPERFWRVKVERSIDKNLIRDAIKAGETVPGCALSNAPMTIKVRT